MTDDCLKVLKQAGVIVNGNRLTVTCEDRDHPVNYTGIVTSEDISAGLELDGCLYPRINITGIALAKDGDKNGSWFPRQRPSNPAAVNVH